MSHVLVTSCSNTATQEASWFEAHENQERELLEAKREILKLISQLQRTEEERDILKKAARYFASQPE